jgi:hypothetical protein
MYVGMHVGGGHGLLMVIVNLVGLILVGVQNFEPLHREPQQLPSPTYIEHHSNKWSRNNIRAVNNQTHLTGWIGDDEFRN